MIKKIIFSGSVFLLLSVSCKKDRTCSCTVTKTGTTTTDGKVSENLIGFPITLADTSFSQPFNDVQIYDKKITNVTKSTAKSNCVSYSQPYSETVLTSVPASSFSIVMTVTNRGTEKYDCNLK